MLSILFLAADPTDASRLRLGEEAREIQEKLRLAIHRNFEFHQSTSVRPADISQALLDTHPQIVHFSGHGTRDGSICIEDGLGQMHPIQPDALAALFEQFKTQVVCVVLNACYSELQARVIAKQIRYVIGMNQAIGDQAAIAFSIGFYQAIAAGRSIEDAYQLGCVQIRLHNIPEHLTPVLINEIQAPMIQSPSNAADIPRPDPLLPGDKDQPGTQTTNHVVPTASGDHSSGTKIVGYIGNVGSGGQAAIGVNNLQQMTHTPPEWDDVEQRTLQTQLAALEAKLTTLHLSERAINDAKYNLQQVKAELTQTQGAPDIQNLRMAVDWLAHYVPELLTELKNLFAQPRVKRIFTIAGDSAIEWLQDRFGGGANVQH